MLYYDRVLSAIERNDKHIYLVRKKLNFKELEMVKEWPILRRGTFREGGGLVIEKFNNEAEGISPINAYVMPVEKFV